MSYVADKYYTLPQQKTLAIIPKFSGGLSLFASPFIILEAVRDLREGKGSVIHRILIGMSIFDITSSFGYFMSSWLVPRGYIVYSAGNEATCNFSGFLTLSSTGPPMYNAVLAICYLLMIKHRYTDERLRKFEPFVHVGIWLWAYGAPFALIFMHLYNPIGVICWPHERWDCQGGISTETGEPCNSNPMAWLYTLIIHYVPIYSAITILITCMTLIYLEVRRTHQRMLRYCVGGANNNTHAQRRSSDDVRKTAIQAILYSCAFFVTFLPSTIWAIIGYTDAADPFPLVVAAHLCKPLQGFWNCLIFVRTRPGSQAKIRKMLCFYSDRRRRDSSKEKPPMTAAENPTQQLQNESHQRRASLLVRLRERASTVLLSSLSCPFDQSQRSSANHDHGARAVNAGPETHNDESATKEAQQQPSEQARREVSNRKEQGNMNV